MVAKDAEKAASILSDRMRHNIKLDQLAVPTWQAA
jgi:hypothetical protein